LQIILAETDDCRLVANNPGLVAINPGSNEIIVAINPGLKMTGSAGLSIYDCRS